MKGQQFDENDNYKALDTVEPYFVQIDLNDKNPYNTIAKGKAPIHTYHDIVDGDPTWNSLIRFGLISDLLREYLIISKSLALRATNVSIL